MSRRSVTNARYRKDNVGSTRKSASAAKPKRDAGDLSASSKKKAAPKKGFWATLFAPAPDAGVTSPEMRRLRRYWWVFLGSALAIAVLMYFTQAQAWAKPFQIPMLALYAITLGGALYLEFGPIRKARAAAIAASRGGSKKGGKGAKAEAAAKHDAPAKADSAGAPKGGDDAS